METTVIDAVLFHRTVCANVPGGKTGLQTRLEAISTRINHLYSVQGIDRGLQDTSLDDSNVPIKKEDPDAIESLERLSLSGSKGPSSPTSASSPNTRRTWKQGIVGLHNISHSPSMLANTDI